MDGEGDEEEVIKLEEAHEDLIHEIDPFEFPIGTDAFIDLPTKLFEEVPGEIDEGELTDGDTEGDDDE